MAYKIVNNKKGGEKIFSIWWMLVLMIFGIGIVSGVLIFYSADTDVRGLEAKILYERIADCLIDNGYLKDNLLNSDFDFYKECRLSKEILNSNNFYFKIRIFNENKELLKNISGESTNYEKDCEIVLRDEKLEAKKFPRCIKETENVLYYSSEGGKNQVKRAIIEVLTSSNQEGERNPV